VIVGKPVGFLSCQGKGCQKEEKVKRFFILLVLNLLFFLGTQRGTEEAQRFTEI
jgi:hypothetical protein